MVRRRMQATIEALSQARSWNEATSRIKAPDSESAALVRAADAELRLSADALSPSGVKERIASRLERIEAAAGRKMIRGTGILATIGATAPFVGLFGTVWGIMNSFIGISNSTPPISPSSRPASPRRCLPPRLVWRQRSRPW